MSPHVSAHRLREWAPMLRAVGLALAVVYYLGLTSAATAGTCPVPFSKSGKTRIGVFGDSVARGYYEGLVRAFGNDRSVKVIRFAKSATGLVRDDIYDWEKAVKGAGKKHLDIAIVSIGGNDRQNFRVNGRRIDRGTKAWDAEYSRRVGLYLQRLQKGGTKVYWVGLPIVRDAYLNKDFRHFNRIYRARAKNSGVTFIDTSHALGGGSGGYSAFGRLPNGKQGRLRKEDGMHFTRPGDDLMASFIKSRLCGGGSRTVRK